VDFGGGLNQVGFKIKEDRGSFFRKHAGERCFTALSGTHEGRDRGASHSAEELVQIHGSVNHGLNVSLKIRNVNPIFNEATFGLSWKDQRKKNEEDIMKELKEEFSEEAREEATACSRRSILKGLLRSS